MKRRNRLLSLCLCFALLLGCLPTVSATEYLKSDELEEFINASVATGQIERDEIKKIIDNMIASGWTDPEDWKKCVNATIKARATLEYAKKVALEQGIDYTPARAVATEQTEPDALEELKNDFIASGRIERDELEKYINNLTTLGITEPDKLEDFINAYITDKEMREEGRKEVLKYAAEVDETVRAKICKDYYAQHEALHSSRELEDVFIRKYYGCYNGVHVVLMDVIGMLYTCDVLELNIDNLIFDFPSGGCEAMFLAYHDGTFTQVADAFDQGLLKKSNLLSMLKIHYENRSYLPVGATEPIEADEFEIIINARIAAQKAKEAAAEAQAMADEAAADAKASAETAQAAAEAAAAEVAENKAAAKAAQKAAEAAEAAAEAAATAAAEGDAVAAEKAAATAAAAAEAAKAQATAQFAQAKAEAAMKAAEEAQAKADEVAAVAEESEEAYRAQEVANDAKKAAETAAEAAKIAADAAAEADGATAKAAAEVAAIQAEVADAMKEIASLMAEKVKNKVEPPEIPVIPKPPVIPEPPNPLTVAKSQALMQLHVTAYEAFANLGEVFKEEAEKLIEDSVAAIEAAKTVGEVDATLEAALEAIANFCPSKDFADVPAVGNWAHEGIDYAIENKLMEGVDDGIFNPKGTLTRAMLATVLWRSQGEPASHPSGYFTDVAEGSWYAEAVEWAHQEGIVYGTGGRNFSPDAPVTRETFATMLYRLSGADEAPQKKNPTWEFKDLATVSSWAKDAVDWAIEEGVLQGIETEDGLYLAPARPITRAEAATMLMRYMEGTSPDMKAVDLMEGYYPQIIDPNSPMTEESMEAIADFSVSLFQKTVSGEENTVISPLSVLYALTMLTNGAKGDTLDELQRTIGLSKEEMNQAMYLLRSALNDQFCNVNVANSIWIRDGFDVNPEFLRENAKWLDADAYQAPYDDSTIEDMNNWISHNTDGIIENMVQELSPATVITLINALLFQGEWTDPYQDTWEAPFYRTDGTAETADMLYGSEYIYLHDDMATGFRKSFEGRKYEFAVIVPNEGVALEDYIAQMDGASLRTMLQGEVYDAVYTTMPAFSTEYSVGLADLLKEMGIHDAFDPNEADLSGIAENLYVSEVTHKAVIDVEESGVSAGAATIVEIAPSAPVIEKTATVVADRPYLYMIIDTESRLPLFMGTTLSVA